MTDPERITMTTAESGPASSVFRAAASFHQLALVVANGAYALARYTLGDGAVTLGRDPGDDAAFRVPDVEVSRKHVVIERDADGRWWTVDAGSRNGTFVDGVRAARSPLVHGSVIRIGRSILVFVDATIASTARLEAETASLRGNSLAMQLVRGEIATVGPSAVPVLVLGETGTGKERVAEEIHRASQRKGPFVALNCAAIPSALAETELFGHTAGAFTGAVQKSEGLFASAAGGTLFLDEVGELELPVQAKLLRALATGEVRPVGRTDTSIIDVRVVAATHRDLHAQVEAGMFRADLLARLAAWTIRIAPLRGRRDDVLRLAETFLANRACAPSLSVSAGEALARFDWPFNVRQLEQVLDAAALRAGRDPIRAEHLPEEIALAVAGREKPSARPPCAPIEILVPREAAPDLAQLEHVFRHFDGNMAQVADYFRKDRKQVYRWAEKLGVDPSRFRSSSEPR